jgi:hypothetical protein
MEAISLGIHCIIPNFDSYLHASPPHSLLSKTLARTAFTPLTHTHLNSLLCHLFQVSSVPQPPVAPFTGLVDRLATAQNYWLRADPAVLQAGMTTLHYQACPPDALHSLSLASLQPIIHQLQALLAPWSIFLHTPTVERWYLCLAADPKLPMTAPENLKNPLSREDLLPVENDTPIPWQRLLTEIQMVLHAAALPFNTLWLWGGGFLPIAPQTPHFKQVWADQLFTCGLAHWQKSLLTPLTELLHNLAGFSPTERCLLVLDTSIPADRIAVCIERLIQIVQQAKIQALYLYDIKRQSIYTIKPSKIQIFLKRWRDREKRSKSFDKEIG